VTRAATVAQPDGVTAPPAVEPRIPFGTLNERPLHAALKRHFHQPGDAIEAHVDGFHIDLLRGDLLIEIQTGNFTALRRKLVRLLATHRVQVVVPLAAEKWIVRMGEDGTVVSRRKSPKRCRVEHMFAHLVSLAPLLAHAHLQVLVVLIREEEIRRRTGARRWRRQGWGTHERRLLDVVSCHAFTRAEDYLALLPPELPDAFGSADVAQGAGLPREVAQQMLYTLRGMGAVACLGRRGRGLAYCAV
jgi:hypothetical protein